MDFKDKFEKLKASTKKHSPELITGALTIAGSVGWIMAGVYARKAEKLAQQEQSRYGVFGQEEWPTIEVSPDTFDRINKGATLKYRMYSGEPDRTMVQFTTNDEFPEAADKAYFAGTPGRGSSSTN